MSSDPGLANRCAFRIVSLAGDGDGVALVTRDSDQRTAATALGLTVR
jgi:hypothetical protein